MTTKQARKILGNVSQDELQQIVQDLSAKPFFEKQDTRRYHAALHLIKWGDE